MGVREIILYKVEKIRYKALNKKNNETLKKNSAKNCRSQISKHCQRTSYKLPTI